MDIMRYISEKVREAEEPVTITPPYKAIAILTLLSGTTASIIGASVGYLYKKDWKTGALSAGFAAVAMTLLGSMLVYRAVKNLVERHTPPPIPEQGSIPSPWISSVYP